MPHALRNYLGVFVLCGLSIIGCSNTDTTNTDTTKTDSPSTPGDSSPVKSETSSEEMSISGLTVSKSEWGQTSSGETVHAFTLTNANGMKAVIIELGGILHGLEVPDKEGNTVDILLGCDTVEGYMNDSPHFGATTGRYANRIAKGKFTLDGTEYTLATNNPPNHLHGGDIGYNKVLWAGQSIDENGQNGEVGVKLTYLSKDMEEGYPGNLQNTVTYSLNNDNELKVYFEATTDKPTIVNLTNHAYYNLSGYNAGSILDHELTIYATHHTPTDETFITTGDIEIVIGTPLGFTLPKAIGQDIEEILGDPGGYDHNYVLDHEGKTLGIAARVSDPRSGRVMEIWNDEVGLQFYTGNFLDGSFTGKDGAVYHKNSGFCLESQKFPDSPNHPEFPSATLRPGETYEHTIIMKFSNE